MILQRLAHRVCLLALVACGPFAARVASAQSLPSAPPPGSTSAIVEIGGPPTPPVASSEPAAPSVSSPRPEPPAPMGIAYHPEVLIEPLTDRNAYPTLAITERRPSRPRLLFSVGYPLAVGAIGNLVAGTLAGLDVAVGVQLNRLVSVQAQGLLGLFPYYGRTAAIVGFSVSQVVTLGFGPAATFAPEFSNFGAASVMLSLAGEVSFLIGPNAAPGDRRHGFMLSLRVDPGVTVGTYGGFSSYAPAGYFALAGALVVGYATR